MKKLLTKKLSSMAVIVTPLLLLFATSASAIECPNENKLYVEVDLYSNASGIVIFSGSDSQFGLPKTKDPMCMSANQFTKAHIYLNTKDPEARTWAEQGVNIVGCEIKKDPNVAYVFKGTIGKDKNGYYISQNGEKSYDSIKCVMGSEIN